jgi:hypothetical protein
MTYNYLFHLMYEMRPLLNLTLLVHVVLLRFR